MSIRPLCANAKLPRQHGSRCVPSAIALAAIERPLFYEIVSTRDLPLCHAVRERTIHLEPRGSRLEVASANS